VSLSKSNRITKEMSPNIGQGSMLTGGNRKRGHMGTHLPPHPEGLTLYQFDIKGAFLNAPCTDQVYLNFPGKYRLHKGKDFKCLKLIYGLQQAATGWNKMFAS
jgi:hypothetical protein